MFNTSCPLPEGIWCGKIMEYVDPDAYHWMKVAIEI
jgi:hypothetical protein